MNIEVEIPKFLQDDDLPWNKWVKYRGTDVFACVNWEKSEKAHRAIIDISYCVTAAFNGQVIKTVNWKKELFTKSILE